MIRPRVENRWVGAKSGLSCIIRVTTLPGGEVRDAQVVRSSGDPAFDRSAEAAVLKSSPLPMPADAKVAQALRSFQFLFKPD